MLALALGLFAVQAATMGVDERFHRRRGLPRWERIGHPLDTATVLACYAFLIATRPSRQRAFVYAALVLFSAVFVTKDEPLHAARCSAAEHWVHALLFVLHPTVLAAAGLLWWTSAPLGDAVVIAQAALTATFALYQLVYWNLWSGRWRPAR